MFEYDDGSEYSREINELCYSRPGIFQVYCALTEQVFIGESENVYRSLRKMYEDLNRGICENEELLKDYQYYGTLNFRFEWVDISEELKDPELRKQRVEELKGHYRPNIY